MNENVTLLRPDDRFRFSCSKSVPCYNECCRDLNQFLTPYDILRIKNGLGLSSGEFLQRYTTRHVGPETGLPIVTLKASPARALACPFVTTAGCSVYEDRPGSCRGYPLMRVASRQRESGRIDEQYLLLREGHCRGFDQTQTQTVSNWVEEQGLSIYNRMNDLLMEIIGLKSRLIPGPLDVAAGHLFYMACYDLDGFRSYLFEKGGMPAVREMDAETVKEIETGDEALLTFGLQWVKRQLFDAG